MSTIIPQTPSRSVVARNGRAVVVRGGGIVGPAGATGPQGPPGEGGAGSLPNVLPAQVTALVLGGTVERTGQMSAAAPATGIAAEATVQAVLSSVTALYTTLGEALTNGFIGIAGDDEGP